MKRQQDALASPDRSGLKQQFETLRRDIRRLQLEKDLLKKANEPMGEISPAPRNVLNRDFSASAPNEK